MKKIEDREEKVTIYEAAVVRGPGHLVILSCDHLHLTPEEARDCAKRLEGTIVGRVWFSDREEP